VDRDPLGDTARRMSRHQAPKMLSRLLLFVLICSFLINLKGEHGKSLPYLHAVGYTIKKAFLRAGPPKGVNPQGSRTTGFGWKRLRLPFGKEEQDHWVAHF